ncbi:heavy-metal-associated domain-containing protein [Campylobacter mucosalis]|uniref:heavy-metal-associated domain-containing protein n=1 Tax=Campylobacter mucosalis TaxID=202 RepID=UPI0014705C3F|nr:heavy-metal-associated domain-containing protein [Campylobacter mucosalis]
MRKFEVDGVNCANCAKTIKNSLEDEFGNIDVNLDVMPRQLSVNIDEAMIKKFKAELDELGFRVIREI